ncbi:MAG: hypothetical protein NXI24_24700 [bacterium]|nr:hypothetical protein [bacterium]
MPVYQFTEFEWPLLMLTVGALIATAPLFFILSRARLRWILLIEALLLPFLILTIVRPSLHLAIDGFTVPSARSTPLRLEASLRPWFVFAGEYSWLDLRLSPDAIQSLQRSRDVQIRCRLWMHNGGYLTGDTSLDFDGSETKWRLHSRDDERGKGHIVCSAKGEPSKHLSDAAAPWPFTFTYLPAWLRYAAYILTTAWIALSFWMTWLRLWRTASLDLRSQHPNKPEGSP